MHPDDRQALADLLATARREGRQLRNLPARLIPEDPREAYRVAALVGQALGWEPLGWKIAGTTPEMQRRLRVGHPIYGQSWSRYAMASPARLRHADLLDPLIECEFLVRLRTDLPPRSAPYTVAEVRAAIAAVHAGIEVAECRFPLDALPPIAAILADGSASGRYVIGPEIAPDADLPTMAVTLTVNGTERRRGSGREVMDDPINPLVWLANERSAWGDGLKAGAVISTGTATGMYLARAGDRVTARFGDVAEVSIAFDA